MEESLKKNYSNIEEIDLTIIYTVLKKRLKELTIYAFSFLSLSIIYSLSLPNIYHSSAVLISSQFDDSLSNATKDYDSLASFAGIDISSQVYVTNADKAAKKISTLSFFKNNILPNIHLPDLMAVDSWDHENNILIFDDKIYNESNKTWVRDFSYPRKQIPSYQESYEKFHENHFSMLKDDDAGFITLTIKHQSPYVAKEWTELIANQINIFYRAEDRAKAKKSIAYLNTQMTQTNFSEVKELIARLLQKETQKLSLVEANDDYVFEFIDPPAVMEEKAEPNRLIIVFFGALFGIIIGSTVILVRFFNSDKEGLNPNDI